MNFNGKIDVGPAGQDAIVNLSQTQSIKGDKGERGLTGLRGPKGEMGFQGPPGFDGPKGKL